MKLRSWLLVPAAVTITLIGATAVPAHAVTLTSGHVDVIDVDWPTGSPLVFNTLDPSGVEHDPNTVVIDVPPAAKTTVPSGSAWSFLGTAGSTVWVLPDSVGSGLVEAGWNTTEVTAAGSVNFSLQTVTGDPPPAAAPGNFSIYTVTLATPTVLFNSGNGLPDNLSVLANRHKHANWAFTAAGTYKVTFQITGTGGASDSGTVTFTVRN